jgi:hypothetical protein
MSQLLSMQAMPVLDELVTPTVTLPFDVPATNPGLARLEQHTAEWAASWRLLPTPAAGRRFHELNNAVLAANCYPFAGQTELELAGDWCAWLFLFDDQGDEGAWGRQPDLWSRLVAPFLRLVDSACESPPPGAAPLLAALHDLMRRTLPGMTGRWINRFQRHLTAFLDAYGYHAANFATDKVPDLQAFIVHRRDSGAMRIVLDLVEPTSHVELPADWLGSAELRALYDVAGDVVSWENDLGSWRKELARQDRHNLPQVLMASYGCTPQQALDHTRALIHAKTDVFLAGRRLVERLLERSPAHVSHTVTTCIDGYQAWMTGNHAFVPASGRYSTIVHTPHGTPPDYIAPLMGQR